MTAAATWPAGLSREELDAQYSPSTCARDAASTLHRYAADTARARATLRPRLNVAYGHDPAELLDLYSAPGKTTAPLLVYVHGGHWQQSGRHEAAFVAPELVSAGVSVVAVGYGLAPFRTLEAMIVSVGRALRWLHENAVGLGIDPARVVAAGSSAGAHLLAAACMPGRPAAKTPLRGMLLLSGVYDLSLVPDTYVNEALGLDAAQAAAASPVRRPPAIAGEVLLARGTEETEEYGRQQRLMAEALAASGHAPEELVVHGRDHFELPYDLICPNTAIGSWLLRLLAAQPRAAVDDGADEQEA